MHMVLDGSSLLVRQAKPADVAEDADGPPAMPMDAHGIVVMGCAYVMQQRPEDDAVAGQPTAVGERKLARFQRVLCKAPRHMMMGVAADSEKVALAKIVDDTLNALAVCAAQQAQDILPGLFVRHDFCDVFLNIYSRKLIFFHSGD